MAHRVKRKRPLKDKIIIGISVTLMVISVLAVIFVLLWNVKLFQGKNGDIVNNSDVLDNTDQNTNEIGSGQINILLCGLDESEQMTDIIMLACIDVQKNSVNVLQIPRDTYVKEGTASTGKINSAYNSGDSTLTPINRLIKVINEQYQLKVDHYATVTIDSFRNIVDAIGGVPIDMPYAVGNKEYGIIPKGYQVLDGEHAEWLVRHRHSYYDQDIGRMKVQRLFLAAALQQVKQIGLKEVTKLLPAVYGNITTDLSVANMKDYAGLALNINLENVNMFIVPGEGVTYRGQSVWSMHYYETADMLNEYFRAYTDDIPAEELKITELAHTGEYYENTQDDLEDLINGATPGEQKTNTTEPVYTHVVTQPKPLVTTTIATTASVTTTTAVTSPPDTSSTETETPDETSDTTAKSETSKTVSKTSKPDSSSDDDDNDDNNNDDDDNDDDDDN